MGVWLEATSGKARGEILCGAKSPGPFAFDRIVLRWKLLALFYPNGAPRNACAAYGK